MCTYIYQKILNEINNFTLVVFICFEETTLFVTEDGTSVSVTISATNPLSTELMLTMDIADVTAIGQYSLIVAKLFYRPIFNRRN